MSASPGFGNASIWRTRSASSTVKAGLGLGAKASGLTVQQIVALRFASDAELSTLIDQAAAGTLKTSQEIKAAIRTWRPDYVRV